MKCEKQISYNRPAADLVLPESPELERAVLGALILEPEYLPDTAEMIEISAFQTPIHGKIYGMMLSMLAEGVKIDLYTLTQRCKTVEGLGNPAAYLAKLTQAVGSGVKSSTMPGSSKTRRPAAGCVYSAMNSQYGRPPIPRAFWIGRQQK